MQVTFNKKYQPDLGSIALAKIAGVASNGAKCLHQLARLDMNIERIRERIRKSPLRMTRKRDCLLNALLTLDRPVSVEELRVLADLPPSDLVTVYRTIEAFSGIGIVQGIPLESGGTIYELTEPGDHHHHLICRVCHKTERLDVCMGKELEQKAHNLGFRDVTHVMEVYGSCKDCE
ncbi:MAG: Fur family transcriptional regulator [Verrucomicrobiales bacterium]|nr:Fur family transcriptional regulator [Verrucomicrobiales bacterium]